MKLYGRNPVLERLKNAPRTILKIYLQEGHPESGYINQKAKQFAVPVLVVPATKLQKLARHANTQGLVAEVEDFVYADWTDILNAPPGGDRRTLVFIDEWNDPQNLGALIRSLACLGKFAVVLPKHHSVDVTEAVLRVACGGENHVLVVKVKNLVAALLQAKEAGYWVAGAVVKGGVDIQSVAWTFPAAVVIGSEQRGLREVVLKELDCALTIPMAHPRMVMNAAQATTVLAYEMMRQKRSG